MAAFGRSNIVMESIGINWNQSKSIGIDRNQLELIGINRNQPESISGNRSGITQSHVILTELTGRQILLAEDLQALKCDL
jgi:hypothetical protein